MAAFGNLIWFVFIFGWFQALLWLLIAGVFAITIIGLPIARACLEFVKLSAFPFGKEIIRDTELLGKDNVSVIIKTINIILGIIWFPIGLILTISYFALALACFVSIIGIPFGIAFVRIGKFVLFPMGARVVSKKQAYAIAAANEMAKRIDKTEVQYETGNTIIAHNAQNASAVVFPKENVLAVAAGILVFFLLVRFLKIPSPFFNGWVWARAVVAAVAIIFGGIAGGLTGLLGCTFAIISQGFSPVAIAYIIESGLFGLLTGIICQKFMVVKKENGIIINIAFVLLITYVLGILTLFIQNLLVPIIITVWNIILNIKSYRFFHNFLSDLGDFGSDAFRRQFSYYLPDGLLYSLKEGLIPSIISSCSAFAFIKWRMKKANSHPVLIS